MAGQQRDVVRRIMNQPDISKALFFKMHCWVAALKITLASLIGIFLIARFNINNGYALLLPMVIIPIVYHQTIEKNLIERGLGALIGSVTGISLLTLTQNWMVYTASIFFIMVFALVYGTAKNIKYTSIWVFITLGLIYSTAHTEVSGINSMMTSWVINLWIGSFVYLLVDYSLFSQYPFKQLQKILSYIPLEKINPKELQTLLNVSRFRIPKSLFNSTQYTVKIFDELYLENQKIIKNIKELESVFSNLPELKLLVQNISESIDVYAKTFTQTSQPKVGIQPAKEILQANIHELEIFLTKSTALENGLSLSWQDTTKLHSLFSHCNELIAISPEKIKEELKQANTEKKAHATTMSESWNATKVVCSFLITIIVTSFLDLPGGFQIVIVAAVAAMQPNLGSLQKKIFDRMIGIILGVSASLFFILLLSQIPTLWCLIFVYTSWILLTAYLGISRPDCFYIAVQAAVIVILVVALDTQEIVPSINIIWERIVAIFEGYIISTLVMTLLKLTDPTSAIPLKMKNYLKTLQAFMDPAQIPGPDLSNLQKQYTEIHALTQALIYQFGTTKKFQNYYQTCHLELKEVQSCLNSLPPSLQKGVTHNNFPQRETVVPQKFSAHLYKSYELLAEILKKDLSTPDLAEEYLSLATLMDKELQAIMNQRNFQELPFQDKNFFLHAQSCLRNIIQALYTLSLHCQGTTP